MEPNENPAGCAESSSSLGACLLFCKRQKPLRVVTRMALAPSVLRCLHRLGRHREAPADEVMQGA